MKFFLDSEFMEDGRTIDLLSLAIVCENGAEFYGEFSDADFSKANPWVRENVIPQLWGDRLDFWNGFKWKHAMNEGIGGFGPKIAIIPEIVGFIRNQMPEGVKPEFWGYYADYDWVGFCQLFGTMMDLPKGFPMYCRDIKQLCDFLGNPRLPEQGKGEHHALRDARWNRDAFEFLKRSATAK